jgi:hypothetical protein
MIDRGTAISQVCHGRERVFKTSEKHITYCRHIICRDINPVAPRQLHSHNRDYQAQVKIDMVKRMQRSSRVCRSLVAPKSGLVYYLSNPSLYPMAQPTSL